MTDTEKILEAVSQGPLPLHVLRRRTGLNHGLEMALRPLVTQGRLVRHGEMVALPVPSYADPIQPLGEMEGDDHTEEWHGNEDDRPTDEFGAVEGPTVPMPTEEMPDPVIVGPPDDPDATRVMQPVEFRGDFGSPPPEEIEQTYLVATEWTEVSAYSAEGAASHVLDEHPEGAQVLVMLAEEGIVFERALVVRRKP